MASKKSASKRAAKKSTARRSATPISEKDRRSAARTKAYELYGEQLNAILNVDIAGVAPNLAELERILARNNCTATDICNYLKKLAAWLIWFQADYTRLRRAVCNVERRAWGGPGDPALRFCTSGPGSEPADPTPPPIWS